MSGDASRQPSSASVEGGNSLHEAICIAMGPRRRFGISKPNGRVRLLPDERAVFGSLTLVKCRVLRATRMP